MTNIDLPDTDLSKTRELLQAIYGPEKLDEQLINLITNRLYTYRRDMIDHAKRIDKKRGKELEQWL